jgi:hypothetical protein
LISSFSNFQERFTIQNMSSAKDRGQDLSYLCFEVMKRNAQQREVKMTTATTNSSTTMEAAFVVRPPPPFAFYVSSVHRTCIITRPLQKKV